MSVGEPSLFDDVIAAKFGSKVTHSVPGSFPAFAGKAVTEGVVRGKQVVIGKFVRLIACIGSDRCETDFGCLYKAAPGEWVC
jgi:hypothetical protein